MDADCVLFSGGKVICGPQSSGFMIAKTWLVNGARANACPNETTFGRPMKTSKESIVGLLAALEEFVKEHDKYPESINVMASNLKSLLVQCPTSKCAFNVVLKSGEELGLQDVQPNMHELVFLELKEEFASFVLENHKAFRNTFNVLVKQHSEIRTEHSVYGDGVSHGSPLDIKIRNPATLLASRLANRQPHKIAVNTTSSGLMINPIVLSKEEAVYVAESIKIEVENIAKEVGYT